MKTFKEVAHHYIGVTVETSIRKATKKGEPMARKTGVLEAVSLFYRGRDKAEILLDEETDPTDITYVAWDSIKPILRRLESMTDEEQLTAISFRNRAREDYMDKRLVWVCHHLMAAAETEYLLSIHMDLFGLIDSGQAIDASTLNNQQ